MKNIEIIMDWPKMISAVDKTDNQSVSIFRNDQDDLTGDNAKCTVMSCLIGDVIPERGECTWEEAFSVIQRMFNGTAL